MKNELKTQYSLYWDIFAQSARKHTHTLLDLHVTKKADVCDFP